MDETVSAEVLSALSHPLRLAVLVALEAREQTPTELAAHLGVREPELMQHVALLCGAHLVDEAPASGLLRSTGRGWTTIAAHLRRLQDGSGGS